MFPDGRMKKTWIGGFFFNAKGMGILLVAALLTVCVALLSVVGDASAQEDVKAVHNLALASSEPGELEVTWDVPTETPVDYRVSWARDGENFTTWTDLSGNAFPHDKFVYGYRPGRGRALQGAGARPLPGDRRRPARRLERCGAGGRYGCADGDPDAHADIYCYADVYGDTD